MSLLRAHFGALPAPLKINLCVTYWCQYRCLTCNIWKRKPTDELSTDELLKLVRTARDTAWLDVTGGEIFLRQDIGDILEAIVRQWTRLTVLHFPTNGFLTDRIVKSVQGLSRNCPVPIVITVSLDGDEVLNDEIRGIRGGFRRQIATFQELRRIRGVKAVFGMTLSKHNVGTIDSTFAAVQRECPGLSFDDFHVNVAQRSSHYYANEDAALLPTLEQTRADLTLYRSRRGVPRSIPALVERAYLHYLDRYLETGRTPMPCHALRSSCFIDPWGVVYPCITYERPVGRLRDVDMDLPRIWRDGATRSLQQDIWAGDCPQCWTACEAYQTILGNALAPWRLGSSKPPAQASPVTVSTGKDS